MRLASALTISWRSGLAHRVKGDQAMGWASARVATVIARPIQSVFTFVCDPKNDPVWMPNLGPGRQTTVGPIGLGTRFQQSVTYFGGSSDVEWEITEFSPNRRVSGKSIAGHITFNGGYEFAPKGASTLITKIGAVHLSGVLSFIPARMADALLIGDFQNAIGRLKRLLERQTKTNKHS